MSDKLKAYEFIAQTREAINKAEELLNLASIQSARQAEFIVQARSILVRLAQHCNGNRYTVVGMGSGLTPQFIGCAVYRRHAADEHCLPCEAQMLLLEADKKVIENKRTSG